MKTNSLSILFTITSVSLAQSNDASRLDRVERDISELGFIVRQLSDKVDKAFSSKPTPELPHQKAPSNRTHLVRTGDTYWGIARLYGVKVQALCSANPGVSAKKLPIGKHINLPGSPSNEAVVTQSSPPEGYTVRKGDTLGHIAQRNGVPLKSLIANNPGINPKRMQIGTVLQIPSKAIPAPAAVKEPVESTPPAREIEELPPVPEPPAYTPEVAPEPEVPPISVEEATPPPILGQKDEEEPDSLPSDFDLIAPDPEPTDLVVIDENSRLTDIASRYLTDVSTLNKLNNVELAPDQMIKSGSQLYIPRH